MEKVYYYNHKGALKATFNEPPYYMRLDTGEFKNHSWGFDEQFGKYTNFRRAKNSYPFSVIITSDSLEDYDALCDIFDEDVIAGQKGYFIINGWRLDCKVITAAHQFYGELDHVIDFEAVTEAPVWTRRVTHSYNGTGSGGAGGEDLGRNYSYRDDILGRGYNYGYDEADSQYAVLPMSGSDTGFEMIVYGPAINPVVYLNNKPIKVNVSIDESERLRIVSNGAEKTIDILGPGNTSESTFVYRDKEHSPFLALEKNNELTYGAIRFDFTTIERRSEPTWI